MFQNLLGRGMDNLLGHCVGVARFIGPRREGGIMRGEGGIIRGRGEGEGGRGMVEYNEFIHMLIHTRRYLLNA